MRAFARILLLVCLLPVALGCSTPSDDQDGSLRQELQAAHQQL